MASGFKIVDIFAGPGGLAEGFASFRTFEGCAPFQVALSVEKEPSAFSTLRLRAFTRQFETLPAEYYHYVAGQLHRAELSRIYPKQWAAAAQETRMLELGTATARSELDPILDRIRSDGETILIGGPPCQAYSLVGRARNKGNAGYVPAEDHRHFLYREYIRIIDRLEPAAFVMENVKGMLSSKVDGESVIDRIISDLRGIGGTKGKYKLVPLVDHVGAGLRGNVAYAEQFGIPQKRHRVILIGIRADIAAGVDVLPVLEPAQVKLCVRDVIAGMERLRSGLSRGGDNALRWQQETTAAFANAAQAAGEVSSLKEVEKRLREYGKQLSAGESELSRKGGRADPLDRMELATWLQDKELALLPNHESRGHMITDLARYAFVATFGEVNGRTPKAKEFPVGLAPDHRSWTSGKFADRFRVQLWDEPSSTITSHIAKDGHYFIHPDPLQCRSLTVREAARLQTFPDNYFFEGNRTQQYVQVGNAVPPLLAKQIAGLLWKILRSSSDFGADQAMVGVLVQ